jgi:hypothetical protein
MVRSWYTITTDKDEYCLFFLDYTIDDTDEDNIGIYVIDMVSLEDFNDMPNWQEQMKCPGIYKRGK